MNESISAIQKVAVEAVQPESARPPAAAEVKSAEIKAEEARARPAAQPSGRAQEAERTAKNQADLPLKAMTDVSLKYKVDSKTKELTVMVVDRKNGKVIRTIPSDELKNFNEGDLIELSY